MKFMLTNKKIIVFLPQNDQFVTFPETHKNYAEVYDFLVKSPDDEKGFLELFIKIATVAIEKYSNGDVEVNDGIATIDGLPLPVDVLQKLKELKADGYDWNDQRKFWGNCLLNPREESVADLFRFISNHNLTITEDGHFLAYKAITKDFKDKFTRTFDNSVGKTVTMNREDVVMNPDVYCAAGLHVSNLRYATSFADHAAGDIIVLVDVNPQDVVSVPKDSNAEKIRTCAYKVVKVWDGYKELPTSVVSIDENNNVVEKLQKQATNTIKKRNSCEWTSIEIDILKKLTKDIKCDIDKFDWNGVSKLLGSRTPDACKYKYSRLIEKLNDAAKKAENKEKSRSNVLWSKEDIKKLKELTKGYKNNMRGSFDWSFIASNFVNRTPESCFYKFYRLNKEKTKEMNTVNGSWTLKDEKKLIKHYCNGDSYKKLCSMFNKSLSCIASKIHRLKKNGKIS